MKNYKYTRKKGGKIDSNPIFNKILSIGFEAETNGLIKLSLVQNSDGKFVFLNTDTNMKHISELKTSKSPFRKQEYNNNLTENNDETFYVTNDIQTNNELIKTLKQYYGDDEYNEDDEEDENDEDDETITNNFLYEIKTNDKEYNINFKFENKNLPYSIFSMVEWIITFYKIKKSDNSILEYFYEAMTKIINHIDKLSSENCSLLQPQPSSEMLPESGNNVILPKCILYNLPDTNLYYLQPLFSKKIEDSIDNIILSIQTTITSKIEDMYSIMKIIIKQDNDDLYYDILIKLEYCVNDLFTSFNETNPEYRIELKTEIGQSIRVLILLILYKIYVYLNIFIKSKYKYFKDTLHLNIRHTNYQLISLLKSYMLEYYKEKGIIFENDNIINDIIKNLIYNGEILASYDMSEKTDSIIEEKDDDLDDDPKKSLYVYFEMLVDNNIEWFESSGIESNSTKMEINDGIIFMEIRLMPRLLYSYFLKNTEDKLRLLTIRDLKQIIKNIKKGGFRKSRKSRKSIKSRKSRK